MLTFAHLTIEAKFSDNILFFVDMDGVDLSSGLQGWLLVKESPFLLAQAELTLLLLWR